MWWAAGCAVAVVALGALLPAPASAIAHSVVATITPPAAPPAEDAVIGISFAADVSSLPRGIGELTARVRIADGTPPCAPAADDDGGALVSLPDGGAISARVSVTGAITLPAPGTYVICAWIEDSDGNSGPPASATMTVRPPTLEVSAVVPTTVQAKSPFEIAVSYQAEVARHLSLAFTRAPTCSFSVRAIREIDLDHLVLVGLTRVAGAGTLTRSARLVRTGRYILCAYFDDFEGDDRSIFNPEHPAALVAGLAAVTVVAAPPPRRACDDVGGPRAVRDVVARGVRCDAARDVARRWGRARRAPRRIDAYRCAAKSGAASCRAGTREITFRFGRRVGRRS